MPDLLLVLGAWHASSSSLPLSSRAEDFQPKLTKILLTVTVGHGWVFRQPVLLAYVAMEFNLDIHAPQSLSNV